MSNKTKREFLQLAHTYEPARDCAAGMFLSEKLDGMRCWWDGGITRGMPKYTIPWANQLKDERYLTPPVSTGLWSRYGNVVHAPAWWLDRLPKCSLDGELYIPHCPRQELMSILKKIDCNMEAFSWSRVKYYIFDMPSFDTILADGDINGVNYCKHFHKFMDWLRPDWLAALTYMPSPSTRFETTYAIMYRILVDWSITIPHAQTQLSFSTADAMRTIQEELDLVTNDGGEGLMLRAPESVYVCERTYKLLKVKKLQDSEATVVGYTTGRETDKGSKLLGLMGALIVKMPSKTNDPRDLVFELSGFTDEERKFETVEMMDWASKNPGSICPDWMNNPKFQRGAVVTFQYRGTSVDGVPQEARYQRPYIKE